jgi:hypothetical protein
MYHDDRNNALDAQIQQLENIKRQLRSRERSLKAREAYLSGVHSQMGAPGNYGQYTSNLKQFENDLKKSLPEFMVPSNVGGINKVAWPFYFQVNMDLGDDPSISTSTFSTGFFQVDQEACFIFMSLSVGFEENDDGSAIKHAPLTVQFIDRQSSRQFQSVPTPIQSLGENSNPSVLPVGMLIMPNAFLDVEMRGIPPVAQSFVGSGKIQWSFFGYRTRVENAAKVLSSIFG